jgi:hypothetical protein
VPEVGDGTVSGAHRREETILSEFIGDADLRRLFDYWRDKRRGRLMPGREDIDPLELAWALSRISLLDHDAETGFRYRLAGAEPSAVFGRGNLKGLTFRDLLSPEGAEIVEERWLPVVTERCVCCMKGMVYLAAERTPIGERIVLPLADRDEGPVTSVLAMTICQWVDSDAPQAVVMSRAEYIPVGEIP